MESLSERLIRLGFQNPEFRDHILPILNRIHRVDILPPEGHEVEPEPKTRFQRLMENVENIGR